jgi:hypothetical protein
MTSLEGFGSGGAGQPERRSSDVASCPRVTVIAPVSPADRARSGHASVEVAYYGFDLGALVLVITQRATHYEGVPVRCSRVQSLRQLHVRRLLLAAIIGC